MTQVFMSIIGENHHPEENIAPGYGWRKNTTQNARVTSKIEKQKCDASGSAKIAKESVAIGRQLEDLDYPGLLLFSPWSPFTFV